MDNYVITIGRSYGSGGRTMGKKLAQELGIDCYDMELLKKASEESGISEHLFGESDEKVPGKMSFRIFKGVYSGGGAGNEAIEKDTKFESMLEEAYCFGSKM